MDEKVIVTQYHKKGWFQKYKITLSFDHFTPSSWENFILSIEKISS